ncbi:MAG: NUDIX domain-containing protein [Planctomycetota bacterium]|nr:MAG: NUDIX domain-containing protein [Planctomycetota bacterium]
MGRSETEEAVVRVSVAVVREGDRVLVGTRRTEPFAGLAEFPGGKCRAGESLAACAVRECREETGLEVVPRGVLDKVRTVIAGRPTIVAFVECVPARRTRRGVSEGRMRGTFRWVRLERLAELTFPPANGGVVRRLLCGGR